ncbi:PREDICTED: cytochrome P450 87A3-like [Nelumbo nucifera]|uniref:Cytochrome P450 87A3-like n=2 Tax=Nelumbo nucifera TaxID=4432 RepID=A0A1U8BFN5_NELNU|nr:PREDICTED: cytochrome P450 87A3-like [Nelumbo nucifera]DAD47340.1 TPA_asm: hypothetical protein HUJ06_017277 [Nelumbo nucifera]
MAEMLVSVSLCVAASLIICIVHLVQKWRNPKCSTGRLPPGSMGLPLIGETLQFFSPHYSFDIPPFLKERIKRYGSLFKTNLVGRPVIVSTDSEFNHYILQQEGKLVELWYMDSFMKLLGDQVLTTSASLSIHKHLRNLVLSYFGPESLKKMVPEVAEMARQTLHFWSTQEAIEVKKSTEDMFFDFGSRKLFSFDLSNSTENIIKNKFADFWEGLISFPLNIPGTTFYKCLKARENVLKMLRNLIKERRNQPKRIKGDFLDKLIEEMEKEGAFLTEEAIVQLIFLLTFASFETTSLTLTLAIKFLTDHPQVLMALTDEHEAILRSRETADSAITWEEYKSMTFTSQVINEVLRLSNVAPGIFRRALTDIQVKGYTIPAGWTIMICPQTLHFDPSKYKDPLAYNPWRWEGCGANTWSKNFNPFGGGMRLCAGADFSKMLMEMFLHFLVTKYRWKRIKGGEIVGNPATSFPNGFHIQVSEKK